MEKILLKLSKTEYEPDCVDEILIYINSFTKDENKEHVSLNILNSLSEIYEKDLGNQKTFKILIFRLSKIVYNNYSLHLLNFYVIYTLLLYNKSKWKDCLDLLPLFEIKNIISQKHFIAYLDLTKKVAVSFIKEMNYNLELGKIIYSNFIYLIESTALKNNAEKSFYVLNMLCGQFNYCEKLITINTKYGYEFIKNLYNAIRCVLKENQDWCLENMNEVLIALTKYSTIFLSFEIKNNLPIEYSLRIFDGCLLKFVNNKLIVIDCCELISQLIKVFICKKENNFEKLFREFDKSLKIFLKKYGESKEICVMDTATTLKQIIKIKFEHISSKINENVFEKLINIYYNLKQLINNIDYTKLNCNKCNNIKHHEIETISDLMLIACNKLIDNNLFVEKFSIVLYDIIKYRLKMISDLKCPFQPHLSKNSLIAVYNLLKKMLNNSILDNYILNVLDLLYKYRKIFNVSEMTEKAVIKLYTIYYSNKNDKLNLLRTQFWNITTLLNGDSITHNDIILEFACTVRTYQSSPELCSMHIIDVLNKKQYYLPEYNEIELLFLQLEAVDLFWGNSELKLTIGKCLINQLDDPIRQGEVLYWLEDSSSQIFENLLKTLYSTLTNVRIKNTKVYAILGLISYRLYMLEFNNIKEQNKNEIFTAETIIEDPLVGWSIHDENIIVNYLNNSLKFYTKFIEMHKEKLENSFMATHTIRIFNNIANHYMLRNNIKQATKAWILTYLLAKYNDDKYGVINAVGYFAEYNNKITNENNIEFLQEEFNDMNSIIENCAITLQEDIKTIENLSRSKQNHILLCVINISLHYANMHQYEQAKFYLNIVNKKLQQLRSNEVLDVVKIKYYGTILIIITKYKCFNLNLSPLNYSKKMLAQIREIKYLTSYDSILIPTILFNLLLEIGSFSINRYDTNGFEPYIFMLLKFAYKLGLSYRGTEILLKISIMNLTAESLKYFLGNIQQINILLKVETMNDVILMKKELQCRENQANSMHNGVIEAVRHAMVQNNNNSNSEKFPNMNIQQKSQNCELLDKYMLTHKTQCDCVYCTDMQLKSYLFQVACLVARFYFINKDYDKCFDVSTKLFKHWETMKKLYDNSNVYTNEFKQFSIRMLLYYGHILRKNHYFARAISIHEESYSILQKLQCHDFALEQDIIHNISSLKFIMNNQSPKTSVRNLYKQISPVKFLFDEDSSSSRTPQPKQKIAAIKSVATTSKKGKIEKRTPSENSENEIPVSIEKSGTNVENHVASVKKSSRIRKQMALSPNPNNILATKRTLRARK